MSTRQPTKNVVRGAVPAEETLRNRPGPTRRLSEEEQSTLVEATRSDEPIEHADHDEVEMEVVVTDDDGTADKKAP